MIDAASNVFMAKAHLSLIKPIVEGYMQKILDEEEWHPRGHDVVQLIVGSEAGFSLETIRNGAEDDNDHCH